MTQTDAVRNEGEPYKLSNISCNVNKLPLPSENRSGDSHEGHTKENNEAEFPQGDQPSMGNNNPRGQISKAFEEDNTTGLAPLLKMIKQHEMSFPDCTLCMNQHQNPVYRFLCGHNFWNYCISCVIKKIGFCPQCSQEKLIPGNQTPGYMTWRTESLKSLPGYEGCETIVITFNFRGGIQGNVDLETFWGLVCC